MTIALYLTPARFMRLLHADSLNVSRDPIMVLMIVLGFVTPALLWRFSPTLDDWSLGTLGIADISVIVGVLAITMPAYLIGWVTGFLLLEDRDDGPLMAMETTPLGKMGFISYRLFVGAIAGFVATFLAAHLLLTCPLTIKLLFALLVAVETMIVALTLVSLASNKVEGLALSKLINIGMLVPLLALIPSPLRFMAGVIPSYWIGEVFYRNGGEISISLLIISHALWLIFLFRLGQRRTG